MSDEMDVEGHRALLQWVDILVTHTTLPHAAARAVEDNIYRNLKAIGRKINDLSWATAAARQYVLYHNSKSEGMAYTLLERALSDIRCEEDSQVNIDQKVQQLTDDVAILKHQPAPLPPDYEHISKVAMMLWVFFAPMIEHVTSAHEITVAASVLDARCNLRLDLLKSIRSIDNPYKAGTPRHSAFEVALKLAGKSVSE